MSLRWGKRIGQLGLSVALLLSFLAGCATPPGYQLVKPTPIDQAMEEVPEDQLLDVGVVVTEARELKEKQLEKLGTNDDIRDAERRYIPYHLKNTLQMSGHWGSVQVVPPEDEAVDLKITSELVKSNGEVLQLEVEAVDAGGRVWLSRKYHAPFVEGQYAATEQGRREAFQDLYNTVANDLAAFKRSLSPAQIEEIRTVSRLRFAADFAPDAFGDYVARGPDGRVVVERLPSDDDPLMTRIDMIHEREDMFVDTLNQYYEGFYVNMWDAYENWRIYNHAELEALRQVQQEAFIRTVGGILMIAAAIALEAGDIDAGPASGILILGGGQVLVGGINVSEQANIHAEAVEELGDSFGSEMRPTVMELEGKQYELTGTASEQYQAWRDLLRRIYYEETGFEPEGEGFATSGTAPAEGLAGP